MLTWSRRFTAPRSAAVGAIELRVSGKKNNRRHHNSGGIF